MNHRRTDDSKSRFAAYVEGLASVIGHKDREGPLRDYCTGLLMPCERKSVEPLAAITAPHRTAAQHQSLLHFIGEGKWSDEKVLAKVREMVLPPIERHGAIEAWIIDDTGFPKQGRHSVGVARQYCGQLGKQDNCQVAVSLSLANHHASLPVAYQLYLPQDWADDRERRRKAGVPEEVEFKTKPEIALEQLRWARKRACRAASRCSMPAMATTRRCGMASRRWGYLTRPAFARPQRCGRPAPRRCRRRRSGRAAAGRRHGCAATASIGRSPSRRWRCASPSQRGRPSLGAKAPPRRSPRASPACAFARRIATRSSSNRAREEWLLIEWPEGEKQPTKYWLSTLPEDIEFAALVDIAKLRWRIERDYQELKQEVGLGHFEGRGWRGFHHHATMCIASLRLPDLRAGDDSPLRTSSRQAVQRTCRSRPVTDPAAPPLRTERHIPNSIATMRRRLTVALAQRMSRCPCCQRTMPARSQQRNL